MPETKQRHGCLTAWLILMIVGNSLTALMYLVASSAIQERLPDAPGWAFPVLGIGGVVNLVCAIALFAWKKWGFYGFGVTSVVAFGVNLTVGVPISQSILGLAGLAILYGVLQIGKENKGWPQLE